MMKSRIVVVALIRHSRTCLFALMVAIAACDDGPTPTAPFSRDPAGGIAGASEDPVGVDGRAIAPANHLGPSKLEIIPVPFGDTQGRAIPFGNNVVNQFTGFMYRNISAFSLEVGDVIAFDLVSTNDVEVRRTIFFATANMNPAACVLDDIELTNPQGIAATSGWTQVVSETQIPENAFGDAVAGNYELRYTAESPFTFPGGGLLVGFRGSPPATFADTGSDGFIDGGRCTDAGGQLYARFFAQPDQTTGALDGSADGIQIGGIVIFPAGGTTTCAEGVSEARDRVAQLFAGRPFLRFLLNLLLTRMQSGLWPNAETNFGLLLDFAAQQGIITPQDATALKGLVAPC